MARFLDEPLDIPVRTYRKAMAISHKYSMEDIQARIAVMVSKQIDRDGDTDSVPLSISLERLCLLFEHPTCFLLQTARLALRQVNCTTVTAKDLKPFQNRVVVIAAVLRYMAHRPSEKGYAMLKSVGFL